MTCPRGREALACGQYRREGLPPTDHPAACDRRSGRGVGGAKALSLARMMRAPSGPSWPCVTGAVYRRHASCAPLADRIEDMLRESGDRQDTTGSLARLREAIVEAPLSDGLAREIEGRRGALGAKHVAARSSATADDLPGHSFAGQHGTFLGATFLAGKGHQTSSMWRPAARHLVSRNVSRPLFHGERVTIRAVVMPPQQDCAPRRRPIDH
ncbi:MAG: PEP/pyruvate-binding domain-containing protein [Planctomycetota bacterium]